MGLLKRIDTAIFNALSWATSTKGAFYALTALIAIAVAVNPPTSIQGWLLVIVSEFYQGVALPGLGASAKREGEETRKLLQETHDTVMGELSEIKQMHVEQAAEIAEIKAIHADIHKLLQQKTEG